MVLFIFTSVSLDYGTEVTSNYRIVVLKVRAKPGKLTLTLLQDIEDYYKFFFHILIGHFSLLI